MDDDLDPKKAKLEKPNLDVMSIEELHDYVAEMEAEIERVRAMIEAKTTHRGAADAFFKN